MSRRRRTRGGPAPLLLIALALLVCPVGIPASAAPTGAAPTSATPTSTGHGLVVEGSDHARLLLPHAPAPAGAAGDPAPYANAGYRLHWEPGEEGASLGTVEVDLSPLADPAPCESPSGAAQPGTPATDPGPVERAARRAARGTGDCDPLVSAVLGWMVHNVVSTETAALQPGSAGSRPPDGPAASPRTVLERGHGDAGELAGLAVAMLRAVGLEARPVTGWVVGVPEVGGPHGAHTWIEVRVPGRGWVFSDPLYHHHYVPATYVAGVDAPEAPPHLVERRDRRQTVDLYPAGAPGVTARGFGAGQVAGALRVVVAEDGAAGAPRVRGSAVLDGPGGRLSKVLVAGESVFVGLAGGEYRLEVYLEGRPPLVRRVTVAPKERSAVFLRGGRRPADGSDGGRGDADD